MAAVHVGVGHQNDAPVAQASVKSIVSPMPVPSAVTMFLICLAGEHIIQPGALDVENLAAQWQNRLEVAVAPLFRAPACAVSLDEVQLAAMWHALRAVGQFARQRRIQRVFAAHQLARAAGGIARAGGVQALLDDAC